MPDTHLPSPALRLPEHRGLYIGGAWREPLSGRHVAISSPGDGSALGMVAEAGAADAEAAIAAARAAFPAWRATPPLERATLLRRIAEILRAHAGELAMIDAADCGNPVREMMSDAMIAPPASTSSPAWSPR
jgi:betaine-aldehyde dehydrogenase